MAKHMIREQEPLINMPRVKYKANPTRHGSTITPVNITADDTVRDAPRLL